MRFLPRERRGDAPAVTHGCHTPRHILLASPQGSRHILSLLQEPRGLHDLLLNATELRGIAPASNLPRQHGPRRRSSASIPTCRYHQHQGFTLHLLLTLLPGPIHPKGKPQLQLSQVKMSPAPSFLLRHLNLQSHPPFQFYFLYL